MTEDDKIFLHDFFNGTKYAEKIREMNEFQNKNTPEYSGMFKFLVSLLVKEKISWEIKYHDIETKPLILAEMLNKLRTIQLKDKSDISEMCLFDRYTDSLNDKFNDQSSNDGHDWYLHMLIFNNTKLCAESLLETVKNSGLKEPIYD